MLPPNEGTAIPSESLSCRSGGWMYPHPASRLGPAGPAGGALFAESRNGPNQPKAFTCAGGWTQPTHRLGPATAPPYAGPFSAEPLDQRTPPAPIGEPPRANTSNPPDITTTR